MNNLKAFDSAFGIRRKYGKKDIHDLLTKDQKSQKNKKRQEFLKASHNYSFGTSNSSFGSSIPFDIGSNLGMSYKNPGL